MTPSMVALALQQDSPIAASAQITVGRVALAVLTVAIAWLLIRGSTRLLRFLAGRVARARFFFNRAEPAVRIALWLLAIVLALQILAPSPEAFWAGLGSLALALALGAQDLVKNLIGGIVVLTDRPYQLGDRVRIGDAYGEIDHIGLRSTKLTTSDDTRVTIPNADVLGSKLYNANSGVAECQVVTDLFLPPDVDPVAAARIGREAAAASPYLLPTKPIVVLVSDGFEVGPFLRIRIKAYVHDHRNEPRMQSDITVRAKQEFSRLGWLAGWHRPRPDGTRRGATEPEGANAPEG